MIKDLEIFGDVEANVSLKNYNTYNIASSARFLVEPINIDSLIGLIKYLKKNNISYFIIGNGSNVILSDGFYDGVVIKLSHLNEISIDDEEVFAGAGVMLPKLSKKVIEHDLAGLEWACAIPGTVGGSIVGNAGAYKEAIFDYVTKVVVLDNNIVKEISKEDIKCSYRYTSFKEDKNIIVLGAYFQLRKGNKEESQEIVNRRMKKRLATQPLDYPSAGSVFRNPEGDFAGRIIEEDLGFKGKTIGGAKISEKHANFIINFDNATGADIRELINLIKEEVKKKDNIDLIVEQEFIDWE